MIRIITSITLFFVCQVILGQELADADNKINDALTKIEHKLKGDKEYNFIAQNVPYNKIEELPLSEQQIVLCGNDQVIWLEFKNYEFLINGKESNQLVLVYIGKFKEQKINEQIVSQQNNVKKLAISILDPESVYVFQNAIVHYWNQPDISKLTLAGAVLEGFNALDYHFGVINKLVKNNYSHKACLPFTELSTLINSRIETYKKQQEKLNRLVTIEDIEKKKELGFSAYYPNPFYLGDIAWYIRPQNMDYLAYASSRVESASESLGIWCEPGTISKSTSSDLPQHDVFTDILERLYPEKKDPKSINGQPNRYHEYKFSDFKRISAYVFRGDIRLPEEIYRDDGFWAYSKDKSFNIKTDLAALAKIDQPWQFHEDSPYPYTDGKAYIPTAKKFGITKNYGNNIYALYARNGIEIPFIIGNQDISGIIYKEVAVPVRVAWQDVIGTRANNQLLIGPVYIKKGFEVEDANNFWIILQLFGGKPQCIDVERRFDILKNCKNIVNQAGEIHIDELKQYAANIYGIGYEIIQNIYSMSGVVSNENDNVNFNDQLKDICLDIANTILGVQNSLKRGEFHEDVLQHTSKVEL